MVGNYTNLVTGAAVKTAFPSYIALSISSSASLSWPTESTEGANYVATELDITATAGSLSLAMPSALLGATGPATIITNVGSLSFTLTDSAGTSIIAISAGLTYLVSLTSNSTAAGTWRAMQIGAGSSAATASALADGITIQANAGKLQTEQLVATIHNGDTIVSGMRGKMLVCAGGGGTATLASSASLTVGWWADFSNQTTSAFTIACGGGDGINSQATLILKPGGSVRIVCQIIGAFVTGGSDLLFGGLTGNGAVVLGGGQNATLAVIADAGQPGQVLTSNGPGLPPNFQTLAAPPIPVTGNGFYNGGCRVGARGDAAITVNLSTTPSYGQVDQVRLWISGAGTTVGAGTLTRQSGNSFGSTGYSARISGFTATGTTANATVNFGLRMEAKDAVVWVNQTALFQVLVLQSTGGAVNYTITINKANAADNFTAVTQIGQSSAISVSSGTPTTISFAAALGACGNGVEVIVSAACGAVTTQNFDFADFGLFAGNAAFFGLFNGASALSPFPCVPYDIDLINCKRYLPRWFWTAINTNTHAAYATSTTNAQVPLPYDVEPRIATTAILVGAAGAYSNFDVATGNRFDCTSVPTFVGSSKNALTVQAPSTTSLTTHSPIFFGSGSAGSAAYVIATGAEL